MPAAGLGKFAKKMAKAPDEAFGGAGAARELRAMADGLVRQWKAQVNEEVLRGQRAKQSKLEAAAAERAKQSSRAAASAAAASKQGNPHR